MSGRRIVIAGASGFIGQELLRRFSADGDTVTTVGRDGADVDWTDTVRLVAAVDGCDVLVNLAGRSVNCRYTARNRAVILSSRLRTTARLGEAVRAADVPPTVWLNASTATIYRHADDRPMTEADGEIGSGFSVDVATSWEREFFANRRDGVRQVALRLAIVLGDGSALGPLRGLTRVGLGGPHIGGKTLGGRQMFSWIHIDDVYTAIRLIVDTPALDGPINLASPNPVSDRELMATLRREMGVRFGIPLWGWMLAIGSLVIGTEPELLLKSRWVLPQRLQDAGFRFRHPDLAGALRDIVGR